MINPDWDPLKTLAHMADQQLLMSKAIAGLTESHNNLNRRIFDLEQAYIRACQQKARETAAANAKSNP
jgi:hypothetical protein